MRDAVDVVVVGGRVAGCLTALRLAAQGVRVRLLEAHDPGTDTLSTHFFRGAGLVRALEEVGVLDEVLATGAPPLRCEYFSVDGGPYAQDPPQEPGRIGYCLSVRRSVLDGILARRAAGCGVDVRARTKVADVVLHDGTVSGVVDDQGGVHHADVVVGADGRRSTVARLVRAADEERHPPARAMCYRYVTGWRSPAPVGPEFLLDGQHLMYVFPSDAGVACVALSVPLAEHEAMRADPAGHLDRALRANGQTRDRLDGLEWLGGARVGRPAASVWKQACGRGWALVGDAGTRQDPWAGLGMDTAARQAEIFAEAFTASPGRWHSKYARVRRERTYEAFAETTDLAVDLRRLLT